jgi:hypothetical protein
LLFVAAARKKVQKECGGTLANLRNGKAAIVEMTETAMAQVF